MCKKDSGSGSSQHLHKNLNIYSLEINTWTDFKKQHDFTEGIKRTTEKKRQIIRDLILKEI